MRKGRMCGFVVKQKVLLTEPCEKFIKQEIMRRMGQGRGIGRFMHRGKTDQGQS